MLVLTRRRDEVVMVGEYEVTVVDIRGDKVRLGFTAPKSVPIHRKEIFEALKRDAAGVVSAAAHGACGGEDGKEEVEG